MQFHSEILKNHIFVWYRHLISQSDSYHLCHSYREENCCADLLAKEGYHVVGSFICLFVCLFFFLVCLFFVFFCFPLSFVLSQFEAILDLSQANTSYYQVHKVRPITKRYVLQLVSTITIQGPTEICQVSWNKNIKKQAKCQSHISACKQWHMPHISTYKQWHPTRVSDNISDPINCWHVSPWKSRHFCQSNDATCLGEKVLKLLQSDCDICHQSNFATWRSPTPKLL